MRDRAAMGRVLLAGAAVVVGVFLFVLSYDGGPADPIAPSSPEGAIVFREA